MRRKTRYAITLPRVGTLEYAVLLASIGVHVLTVFLGARLEGFLGGCLSLLFPFAAQAYWIVELWNRTGNFWNPFTIMCALYVALLALLCIKRLRKKSAE
jgi:hypothetical protein